MKNFGKCIIFSAPSGSGKTTLVKDLLYKADLNLSFSVSATTRNKRTGEVDGKDYFFKSKKEFNKLIKNDLLLEYEEVYKDIFYGTLKEEVSKLLKIQNVIFDIDVVGGIKLKNFFKDDALSVFVKPPSVKELKKRLVSRKKDSDKSIEIRIQKAQKEIKEEPNFDITIINDNLDLAKNQSHIAIQNFLSK